MARRDKNSTRLEPYTLDPDTDLPVEDDLPPLTESENDIESMTDEEIDQELAAITAMQAALFERQRERASQGAKQQRELLKEWNGSRVLGINGTEKPG